MASNSTTTKASGGSMQDLIPLMNKLQDVFHTMNQDGIDLPQIVVVGSQSSGKSSVLENIVQKDFLPRGKDVVTRRPLILQLVQTQDGDQEYAEFLHQAGRRFTDFKQVRHEIELETDRVAGQNKGISRMPINLRIFSPRVLNLTLVDLPGIMKVPIGDQPPDIESRIRKLVLEFIAKPNAIILAVSPANQDLVNSDALKIAREVDPEGKRTIGVLTKVDLMDKGTNAYDILINKAFPLKLGFTAVINRSQEDIMNDKPVSESLKEETKFFSQNVAYRSIAGKCGTPYLIRSLNQILMQHIREKLPELKAKLNMMIVQTEQELSSYGDQIFSGQAHQGTLVLKMLTKFSSNFVASIDGTNPDISTHELSGGARLYYIFNSIFGHALASIDPCGGLSTQDIKTAIRNSTGARASLFIPEAAFDLLINPQIKKLETPAMRCVELVFDELLKIVSSCENRELARFPKLHQRVVEVSVELLRERMAPAQQYIESLIAIQTAYVNTNHPDFIGGSAAIAMLERKHAKKRMDADRMRRQQQLTSGIQFATSGLGAANIGAKKDTDSQLSVSAGGIPINKAMTSRGDGHSQIGVSQNSHGRDTGFLTYFFGQQPHQAGSPEPPSNGTTPRSGSPNRQMFMPDDGLDMRSDDGMISLTHPLGHHADKEDLEVELIRSLIASYFSVTRKTIADLVPKSIMHMVVNYGRENLQSRLVTTLYKEEIFNTLLMEDERVAEERTKCQRLLETYRKGATLLQDIF